MEDMRGYNTWKPGKASEPTAHGGRKADSGKPPMSLISRRAQMEEAKVLDFGRRKYSAWNWAEGMAWSRVLSAAMRHLAAYADGEMTDSETGLSHLAHARCCMGFLLDYEESHPELNDLRKHEPKPQMNLFNKEK